MDTKNDKLNQEEQIKKEEQVEKRETEEKLKEDKEQNLVVIKATELNITFPQNDKIEKKESRKIEEGINKGGIVIENKCFLEKNKIKTQLCTDKKGENKFYNDLDDEDKIEVGKEKYASVSAITKEISDRIQQPRDILVQEKLHHSEACLKAFRDNSELEKQRLIEEVRIKKEIPKTIKKKIKDENIKKCELTESEFNNDAEGHHIIRKADDPTKACDPGNIIIIKNEIHKKIHKEGAESPEELEELCKRENWKVPKKIKG